MCVVAILLAAGRSSRMGAFKPLLPFGDKTVIETCVENLLWGGATLVYVVMGHRAEKVEQELSQLRSVRTVLNEEAGSKMGVSIARGVEALQEEARAVLIMPADQPAVPHEVIREVIAAWSEGRAPLVVPTYEGRGGHPVLVDLRFRDELKNLPADRGLRALFDAYSTEVLRLPVDSPYIVRDMDTLEEYLALHEEVFGRRPRGF